MAVPVAPEVVARPATLPFRRTFVGAEAVLACCGVAGAWQLIDGRYVPPMSTIEPLGLDSWVLPGVWLFSSVAVPSAVAAWLAWQRSPYAPAAVLAASGMLAVELVVQIPFLGLHPLQAIFGVPAAAMAALALKARTRGGWPRRR